MRRTAFFTVGLVWAVFAAPAAPAQDWAKAMFRELSHEFGTVAANSKTEHRFLVTNKYKEPMHLVGVSSSCGCTSPSITRQTIKTGETAEVVAVFNTYSFRGQRSAVLTVSFGGQFSALVQLRVAGFIRGDVVLNPPSVSFGRVRSGSPAEQTIDVSYAGRNDWKITDVRAANDYLQAELKETGRGGGRVNYRLTVRLKEGAPQGYLTDQLSLVTNDARGNRIPLDIEGKVEADLTVSPSPLVFGTVQQGAEVAKKIIVRGAKPFRLTSVNCPDGFSAQVGNEAKTYHVVEVKLRPNKPGSLSGKIRFETDLGPGMAVEVPTHAQVTSEVKTK